LNLGPGGRPTATEEEIGFASYEREESRVDYSKLEVLTDATRGEKRRVQRTSGDSRDCAQQNRTGLRHCIEVRSRNLALLRRASLCSEGNTVVRLHHRHEFCTLGRRGEGSIPFGDQGDQAGAFAQGHRRGGRAGQMVEEVKDLASRQARGRKQRHRLATYPVTKQKKKKNVFLFWRCVRMVW